MTTVIRKANDKYRATLRSTWISSPAATSLAVTSLPTNYPTKVTVGWNTEYETVFDIDGVSGTDASNYTLTGVARVKGANVNIPEGTAVNCLNHEEFFNQYEGMLDDLVTNETNAVNSVLLTNTVTGKAPIISATGDDDNINLDLKGKGTGTVRKPTSVSIQVFDGATNTATGDGKFYFTIPEELNGMNLVGVHAAVVTAGTTNTTDIQIANVTDSVDMLSTKLTIDTGETSSATAATAAVIDTTKDDVVTNDLLRIDVDAVSTTAAKGLIVRLRFALP
jgi:hypothetical protein